MIQNNTILPAAIATEETTSLLNRYEAEKGFANIPVRRERFYTYAIEELLNEPDMPQLIENVILENSLVILYGQPGKGKSFVTLGKALAVAAGLPWGGRRTQQGSVIYVAAERSAGLPKRIRSWMQHHQLTKVPAFRMVKDPLQLLDAGQVEEFLTKIERTAPNPRLIVIDTLARCMVGGDENSNRDMTLVIEALDKIRKRTGATIVVIHHTKKGSETERGAGALRGAADTMILVRQQEHGIVVTNEKTNDIPPFEPITFQRVEVGDSCVLVVDPSSRHTAESMMPAESLEVLRHLAEHGQKTRRSISIALDVAWATMQGRLASLEKAGFIAGTGKGVSLTEGGMALVSEA